MGRERPEQSRTKWEDKAEAARDRLLDEGMVRLLEDGVLGLASLVSPSALARRSGAVSVDTAYRLLGAPANVLEEIARRTGDPDFTSEHLGWPTFDEVSARAVDAYEGPEPASGGGVHAALRHYLVSNRSLPSYPMSRLLRAVSLMASPQWDGTIGLSDEARPLAEAIHAADAAAWEQGREHLRWLVQDALATMRRRPRPGMSVEKILLLLYALAEGATDRLMLQSGMLDVDDVVEAVFALGIGLTEDGSFLDPRAPQDPQAFEAFERIVAAADDGWSSGRAFADVRALARAADVPAEAAVLMFGSLTDVADSVLRARALSSGVEVGALAPTHALLVATLQRVAQAGDDMPVVRELALAHQQDLSVFDDLRGLALAVADRTREPGIPVARIVDEAVVNSVRGNEHWGTVEVLLEMIGPA